MEKGNNYMSFADDLRKTSQRDFHKEKMESLIKGTAGTVVFGVKKLAQEYANRGNTCLTGYYDQFYWDGTDYFIYPTTRGVNYTLLSGAESEFSKSEIDYMLQQILKEIHNTFMELGFTNIQLRIDNVAQTDGRKFFARKTGIILHYIWISVSW